MYTILIRKRESSDMWNLGVNGRIILNWSLWESIVSFYVITDRIGWRVPIQQCCITSLASIWAAKWLTPNKDNALFSQTNFSTGLILLRGIIFLVSNWLNVTLTLSFFSFSRKLWEKCLQVTRTLLPNIFILVIRKLSKSQSTRV
jgi:hypothetical protein